ncbi:tol-pal system protein YbgF [Rhodanobacter geophilus]|uniref:Cell division coordinator CpoB n=1 Tax=Rhodanobacter geophilus TaxID=3162488 RepID=A0ABV3QQH2_9GAMM
MAGAIASAMLFVLPVFAQDSRLSLADRVSLLEQRAQNKDQSGVAMVNQLQQMQSQLQQMQGQIEELQHQLQQLQDKSKDQYIDLDSRVGRLEAASKTGAAPASGSSAPATAGSATAPGAAATAAAAAGSAAAPAAKAPPAGNGKPLSAADNAAAQAAYDAAFKTLRGGDYVGASRDFRKFIEQYPDHPLTPNAFYWLGESYYVTTNYQVALQAFQHLLSQFPQSEKAPDALLKVGYCQYELKQVPAAKATLESVVSKYPSSKAASLAKERLSRIQTTAG